MVSSNPAIGVLASRLSADAAPGPLDRAQVRASLRTLENGDGHIVLSVPGIKCGGCIASIERALNAREDVRSARVNLTLRQANVTLAGPDADPVNVIDALAALGFDATPADMGDPDAEKTDVVGRQLLRAMAIAGFGAANIMLLSVGVWSGAEDQTRDTFHLVSALIAVPVVAYAGQPFFASAIGALKARRTNMDVPISLGVILALALSVFETLGGGEHVFFDAAVTLLFFLLAGRYLDHLMRARARSAVTGLARLSPSGAMVRQEDGTVSYVPLSGVSVGAMLSVAPNERLPVDAVIQSGSTDLDCSLITGEAMPVAAGPGDTLEAGTLNLTGTIEVRALRDSDSSFLAQMIRMQTAAETGRAGYVRIADRAARLYAPVVHTLALATFAGWMFVTGGDWQTSAFVAISVLIITCPCALGLAVPVAHVVAAGRLMRMGILMKDGSSLERLAEIDRAVFDKTGTLTTGSPTIAAVPATAAARAAVKALALHSGHPASRAIMMHISDHAQEVSDTTELPGFGVEGWVEGRRARLGRADWVREIAKVPADMASPVFAFEGAPAFSFALSESLRPGAVDAIAVFKGLEVPVAMISGDIESRALHIADAVGIEDVRYGATPAAKIEALEVLRGAGHRALMVGDGLNDTAALAAAHVSMAPSSAADAGRMAADFVFLRDNLGAVPATWQVARDTAKIVRQNFTLAIIYNCIAIPLAVAGVVTPLIAALAMSGSSILVTLNALRLNRAAQPDIRPAAAPVRLKEVAA
ncbi:heavy metal translocating P-type ATPase [Sulfitobacter guttiformis]|uniref:Cu2+-exporting ATPase n=1 Tax=Sulfitobacter guttiformis TaxID=74349 RepID=A0A420DJH2_9RHOB|nr:heavy metal translocating P-type ATPase [Sulfitobacter guttiformis]KIN71818.1 putative nitrogen fixation protein FixI, cation transporting ATPase [Sulfitobacter guttiformis KCTC 32187]RKE94367.1 Cu2+-exporting ATPase [Sulfitobacter guttiformis]